MGRRRRATVRTTATGAAWETPSTTTERWRLTTGWFRKLLKSCWPHTRGFTRPQWQAGVEMRTRKVLLVAELVLRDDQSPQDKLDQFRETVLPSQYGVTLVRAKHVDIVEFLAQTKYVPNAPAPLWLDDLEVHDIEQ